MKEKKIKRGVLVASANPEGDLYLKRKEATNRPPFVQKPNTGRTVND